MTPHTGDTKLEAAVTQLVRAELLHRNAPRPEALDGENIREHEGK